MEKYLQNQRGTEFGVLYGSPGGTPVEVRKLEVWKLEVRKLKVKSDEVRNVEVRSMEGRSQKY